MLEKDERIEENYDNIRNAFEMELIDQWYLLSRVDEIDDWRDEFVDSEYKIYLKW